SSECLCTLWQSGYAAPLVAVFFFQAEDGLRDDEQRLQKMPRLLVGYQSEYLMTCCRGGRAIYGTAALFCSYPFHISRYRYYVDELAGTDGYLSGRGSIAGAGASRIRRYGPLLSGPGTGSRSGAQCDDGLHVAGDAGRGGSAVQPSVPRGGARGRTKTVSAG